MCVCVYIFFFFLFQANYLWKGTGSFPPSGFWWLHPHVGGAEMLSMLLYPLNFLQKEVESEGLIRLVRFFWQDYLIGAAAFFPQESLTVWLHLFFVMLMAVDGQSLGRLLHWRLQNGSNSILPSLFTNCNISIKRNLPQSVFGFYMIQSKKRKAP